MVRTDAEQNRKSILAVFEALVTDNPDRLPTVSEIVQASGLGRGTVYRHFPEIGDLVFAKTREGYLALYASYEPEWIKDGPAALRAAFESFLPRCFEFNLEHHDLLRRRECIGTEGRRLAQAELRRKIFVTITSLSEQPRAPHEVIRWADAIAHCVETEHLSVGSLTELDPALSVSIALGILDHCLSARAPGTLLDEFP